MYRIPKSSHIDHGVIIHAFQIPNLFLGLFGFGFGRNIQDLILKIYFHSFSFYKKGIYAQYTQNDKFIIHNPKLNFLACLL